MNHTEGLNPGQLGFYESTLNNLSEGVLWTNPGGQIVYCNESASRWLGEPRVALVGQSLYPLISSGNIEDWLGTLAENRGEDIMPLDIRLKTGDRILLYAMISVAIKGNRYNCFLMKEDNDEGADPNQMLRLISEGTAAVIGGDFFRSLAYHVIVSTGIRYAIVTECANTARTRVRTLVYIEHDHFLDNFEYDLTGTPCEIVMKGDNYYCTADLDVLFPKDEGVKSYFGVPIFLSNGEVIGHIAIFDTKPLVISERKLNVLKIFASRAGAEIERKRKDETIHQNMARYRSLFEDSPIGMCEEDFSQVKKYIDSLKVKYGTDLLSVFNTTPDEIRNTYRQVVRLHANKSQVKLFDLETEEQYFEYLSNSFMPAAFSDLVVTFDSGETVFEREIEIKTAAGRRRTLKVKRVLLAEHERDWSRSIISCVDTTQQKKAQEDLRDALEEVKTLKERLEAENIYLQQEIKLDHNFEEIVSKSEKFRRALDKVEQVAGTDATVLILGESGTGKELIARAIHNNGRRSKKALVKVNCAALPANLIESELFGHEKGAFTGAIAQKIGRFELADGGTIFLDEIGEMPLDLQSKLLRVLQEGEFERVGSSKTTKINVRVIAATNRDLQASVGNKEFRADLYYRLNVFPIALPPLRERKEDIPLLVTHFCKKYSLKLGKKIEAVAKPVLDALVIYDWPGNVRELENIIERGLIVSASNSLQYGDWLPVQNPGIPVPTGPPAATGDTSKMSLEHLERQHIIGVLNTVNWKIRGENGAAKILELNPTTLEARMKKLGITRHAAF